jgi:hypothetical protein
MADASGLHALSAARLDAPRRFTEALHAHLG